jgi:flagellar biosynthesis protein FliQ
MLKTIKYYMYFNNKKTKTESSTNTYTTDLNNSEMQTNLFLFISILLISLINYLLFSVLKNILQIQIV